jgi:hypothetical protein
MPKITPQNVVEFMSVNIVKTPSNLKSNAIPYVNREKKLVWARLEKIEPEWAPLTPGNGAVYRMDFLTNIQAYDTPDAFLTYWVEYEGDGPGTTTWLGKDAPFMFTALMTGCTLGLGSQTLNGVMAAHVNSKSASKDGNPDEFQKEDQHRKLENLGLTTKEITIDQYLPGQFDPYMKTTPFAYRPQLSGGKVSKGGVKVVQCPTMSLLPWKFCWQKYKQHGKNHTHLGVKQHAGGLF